ncbi:hypothetical protein, partial [Streptococcus pneumoniae]|uniref:hypothetical protein n=1 Tax=Streptococcus pneumoniae TaxID=1313 RepID=UPI0013DC5F50
YAAPFPHARFVYPDAGRLWRTMRVLIDKGGLPLASGSPRALIESVFGAEAIAYPPGLDDSALRAEAKRQA